MKKKIVLPFLIIVGLMPTILIMAQTNEALPTIQVKNVDDVIKIINNVAAWMYRIILAIAGIFVLMAAFTFFSAGEKTENVKKARNQIYYAVVALVVAVLAFSIKEIVIKILTTTTK
ncbi:MAG: hypothetical protein N2692_00625 [Patescibacteria group bacterium]|jgi:uncharacterized protein involved in cysteine biosynthesis|nr:hypothetical protein [Patescibacteria group bacterium]